MKTEDLIKKIAQSGSPGVKLSVGARLALWALIVVIAVGLALLFGKYEIFSDFNQYGEFRGIRTVLLILLAFLTGFTAILNSVDYYYSNRVRLVRRLALSATVLLAALLFGQEFFVAIEPLSIQGFECSKELVLYAIVPTLFLCALLQSLSPNASRLVAALCFIASGILGSIFLEFNCSLEDPSHILVFHILPLLLLGGFGMLLGRVIFSLDRRVARLKKALEESN